MKRYDVEMSWGDHPVATMAEQADGEWVRYADVQAILAALAGAAPVAFPRVETGVVQFGDDWPGVFIRGDNAAAFAMYLRTGDSAWWNAAAASLAKLLESCNVANKPDIRVIPTPHAPAKAREDDGKLRALYDAAAKGFHTSETCGPDGKYLRVSKFQSMADLHSYEDAWLAVMLAAKEAAA